jgi:ABC-type spermidine/putrescine transport system permease subunit I
VATSEAPARPAPPPGEPGPKLPHGRGARRASARAGAWRPRWFWPSFAVPGMVWLVVLFLLPFYVVLSIAFGAVDPLFRTPVPVWNPVQWNPFQFQLLFDRVFGPGGFLGPAFIRTFLYVVAASALCLLLAYPVAYYVTRYAGRRKGLLLVALLAPFWVSYMMRMLAWVNLLENDGMVNRLLVSAGLLAQPFPWLAGQPVTVTLGLVYGYIPYMVLALYAGLDRVDQRLLEAARDLGGQPAPDLRAGHPAPVPPGHPGRRGRDRPAHVRRLLHQRPAVGVAPDLDGRQPDQRRHRQPRPGWPGRRPRPGHDGPAGGADARLHPLHRAGRPGRGEVSR